MGALKYHPASYRIILCTDLYNGCADVVVTPALVLLLLPELLPFSTPRNFPLFDLLVKDLALAFFVLLQSLNLLSVFAVLGLHLLLQ